MNRDTSQSYRLQSVMTASPARQVAMLYDRAVASLKEAIRAIEEGDIERRCRSNGRCMEIIGQMAMALDMEQGGEIASTLDQLYRFMLFRLPQVDLANDPKPALDVINLIEPLRRSWHELADRLASSEQHADMASVMPHAAETQAESNGPGPSRLSVFT